MSQAAYASPPSSAPCGAGPPTDPAPPPAAAMWPEARVEALTRAWRAGLSASQIAARLGGGLTRNAVIGKLHRLGLCGGRKKPAAPRLAFAASPPPGPPSGPRARPGPRLPTMQWPEPHEDAPPTSAAGGSPPDAPRPKYLRDMTPRECRFGLGDPGVGNGAFQFFCAAPTAGHPYCAHHRALAILPPRPLSEQKVTKAEIEALVADGSGKRRSVHRPIVRRSAGAAP